jgi:hypothetical protein
MPPLPSPGKVVRIEYFLDIGTDTFGKCRRYFGYTGTVPTVTDMLTLAGSVRVSFTNHLAGLLFTGSSLLETKCTDLSSSSGAVGIDPTAVAGTRAGTKPTGATCTLVSYETARRFRGGHPRTYWPFGVEDDLLDEQHWSAAYVAVAQTAVNNDNADIIAAVWAGGASLGPVNVSFYEGFTNVSGPTGRMRARSNVRLAPVVDPVSSLIVRTGIAAQRKRLLHLA